MSVRAYKIEKISKSETFNLWHDETFMELLEEVVGLETLNMDGWGIIEIEEHQLKRMSDLLDEKVREGKVCQEEAEEVRKIFDRIKRDFGKKGYANYYCF